MAEIAKKRGRPVGSTNKKNIPSGNNVFITNFDKHIEGTALTKDSSMGWVKFGAKNNWPNILLDLYNQSPTHHAAIQFEVESICQNGIDYNAMKLDDTQIFPNYQYSYDTLIRNIALDYCIYGSYCIEIIRNKGGKDFSFYHIPYEKIRCSPYDEDGVITSYWLSNDWTALGQNPPIQIDAIDMRDDNEIKMGKPYLYVYRNYDPAMQYYQNPSYAAGIKAIQSEIEHCNFDLRTTVNSFVSSGMLVLNEMEDDAQRQAILNNVQSLFQGSDNANSAMVVFRNNIEEQKPEWIPFSSSKDNVNLFDSANQRTINRILCAHSIPSANLIGLPDIGATGFQSDSNKLETAFQLYQKLTGNYNRIQVIKSLNDMFKLNGINVEIIQKPLHFNDFNDTSANDNNSSAADTTSNEVNQDVSEKNVEEKVEGK